jgi:hypothetical protein
MFSRVISRDMRIAFMSLNDRLVLLSVLMISNCYCAVWSLCNINRSLFYIISRLTSFISASRLNCNISRRFISKDIRVLKTFSGNTKCQHILTFSCKDYIPSKWESRACFSCITLAMFIKYIALKYLSNTNLLLMVVRASASNTMD